jgi:hypothetical protein
LIENKNPKKKSKRERNKWVFIILFIYFFHLPGPERLVPGDRHERLKRQKGKKDDASSNSLAARKKYKVEKNNQNSVFFNPSILIFIKSIIKPFLLISQLKFQLPSRSISLCSLCCRLSTACLIA